MEKLISIVVPIYNTAKYLPKCIESLINQSYKNIEIILVDDGSTDECGNICDEYKRKDNRIKVFHKKNEGVSAARNDGILMATGEYITFVDSDDSITYDYCERMLETMIKNTAQIVICSLFLFKEGENIQIKEKELKVERFNSEEAILNLFKKRYFNGAGGKMFCKYLFDDIKFPVGRIYEDAAVMYKLYRAANFVVETNQEYYLYLKQREGSITTVKYDYVRQNNDYLLVTERYDYLIREFPNINQEITSSYIRDIIKVTQSSYLTKDETLMNSKLLTELQEILYEMMGKVDKNVLNKILNTYELASLYLFLHDKELYAKLLNELYETRYNIK